MLAYARTRPDTRDTIGLFSRCMGAGFDARRHDPIPDAFRDVRCLVSPQPVTARIVAERRLAQMGLSDRLDDLDQRIIMRTSIGFAQRNVQESGQERVRSHVPLPGARRRADPPQQRADDLDNIPVADKKLHWIEGTTARWDGYLEFQRRPKPMLESFAKHMSYTGFAIRAGQRPVHALTNRTTKAGSPCK